MTCQQKYKKLLRTQKMNREELEKENAELKEKLEDTEKARDYWKNSSFDWRHERMLN